MNATTATQQYRVLATTTTGFVDPKVDTTVKWQGTDTDELSRLYPPNNVFGADQLFQKEIEGGFIIIRFTFEKQLEDSSWEEIDDPRRRLTPMIDLERAIDAENRRDFPGDYITEDDEDEYDDYDQSDYDYDDDEYQPFCTNCDDSGCAECEPQNVCIRCSNYDPYTSNGVCQGCGQCYNCGVTLPDDADDDICSNCKAQCIWCQSAPQEIGDLCKPCNKAVIEMEREHMHCIGFLWKSYYWLRYRTTLLYRRITTSS